MHHGYSPHLSSYLLCKQVREKHATEVAKLCTWNSHLSPKRIKSPKMWLIWIFLQSFETVKETSGGHVFTELIGPQLHLEHN